MSNNRTDTAPRTTNPYQECPITNKSMQTMMCLLSMSKKEACAQIPPETKTKMMQLNFGILSPLPTKRATRDLNKSMSRRSSHGSLDFLRSNIDRNLGEEFTSTHHASPTQPLQQRTRDQLLEDFPFSKRAPLDCNPSLIQFALARNGRSRQCHRSRSLGPLPTNYFCDLKNTIVHPAKSSCCKALSEEATSVESFFQKRWYGQQPKNPPGDLLSHQLDSELPPESENNMDLSLSSRSLERPTRSR
jgi:hypothetical protein